MTRQYLSANIMNATPTLFDKIESYLRQRSAVSGETLYVARDFDRNAASDNEPTAAKINAASAEDGTVRVDWRAAATLETLRERICECQNCPLGATRTKFVFGAGNPSANLMIIGEAPGADEDAQGEPFVGRAGQLLTKILEAIQLQREDVYIANILKCRPPENRRPEANEVAECEPYLYKQIDLVQPKIILALGLTAANTLLKTKGTMAAMRGKIVNFRGIPMTTTYHPAALLRNPEWKRAVWEDVQALRVYYDKLLAGERLFA